VWDTGTAEKCAMEGSKGQGLKGLGCKELLRHVVKGCVRQLLCKKTLQVSSEGFDSV